MYSCGILRVEENHLPFGVVHFDSDLLWLLFQQQLDSRGALSPEGVPVAQADHPEAFSRVEEDRALPLDGLRGGSDVPVFTLAHVHGPAVLPRGEASGSQHAHAAGAALGVVG